MNRPDTQSFEQHIADLNEQILTLQGSLMPNMMRNLEIAKRSYSSYDQKTSPIWHAILGMQQELLDSELTTLHMTLVTLQEFVQMWQHHRLLSQYVDDAMGETSEAIRTEFHRKQKELEEKLLNDPVRLGIQAYLDKLKEREAKFGGGAGGI